MEKPKELKAPTSSDIRTYLEDREKRIQEEKDRTGKYVIHGASLYELTMINKMTLPLVESAEKVGASLETVWKFCKQLAKYIHAPSTLKEYERMKKYAEATDIVDTVLCTLESYYPPKGDDSYDWFKFDITSYYYCVALISLSDYRVEECKESLSKISKYHLNNNPGHISVLLRNMKTLESQRPYLSLFTVMLQQS